MPFFSLNDTGITLCYGAGRGGEPCPRGDYPGQDGDFGRDALYPDDSDGPAGFVWTRLDAQRAPIGEDQAATACIQDQVTGLVWEAKIEDGGIHDGTWRYSWFDGVNGVPGAGSCPQPGNCDTLWLIEQTNAEALCGRSNWRLPTRLELRSILDYGRTIDQGKPSVIDPRFYPGAERRVAWWTGTRSAVSPDTQAWQAQFDGRFVSRPLSEGARVLLVSD